MFEDKFKKEIEQITPDNELKSQILSKMGEAEKSEPKRRIKAKIIKLRWTAAVAAMLAVTLIALSVFRLPTPQITDTTLENTATVNVAASYNSIYKLFYTIYQKQHPRQTLCEKIYNWATKGTDEIYIEDSYLEYSEDASNMYAGEDTGIIAQNGTTGTATYSDKEEYSETNTQVENVDEADVVKTDGKYIYILDESKDLVTITKATKGDLSKSYVINLNSNKNNQTQISYQDMYVTNNRLIIMGTYYSNSSQYVLSAFYDISNPEAPYFLDELTQSGNLISTRLIGDKLYVFSNQTFYSKPEKNDMSTYVPTTGVGEDLCPVDIQNIHIFDGEIDRQYLIATSADINTAKFIDTKSTLGGGSTVYANTESLYIAKADCLVSYADDNIEEGTNQTELIRFAINEGVISAAAKGSIKGNILNQFSMDENGEYFRIVTTVDSYQTRTQTSDTSDAVSSKYLIENTTYNCLYILDRNLKQIGSIENLAPDERVYSVRFMGNTAYFVTFRQVDPLFAVDLTDPKNPKVLSALKIPGFSNYLHPYSSGLLLGIGKNADENTGRTGTVKLSMFDISDPSNVTERDKTSLDCFYTQADYNHKAALIDKDKNLIAFMGSDYYYIYGYTDSAGFYLRAKLNVNDCNSEIRGLYIGNVFYICGEKSIVSYDINTFKKLCEVTL